MSRLTKDLYDAVQDELSGKMLVFADFNGRLTPQAMKEARAIEGDPSKVRYEDISDDLLNYFNTGDDKEDMRMAIAKILLLNLLDRSDHKDEIFSRINFGYVVRGN